MDCGEFSEAMSELALGVLTGRDRAEALAHADGCGECRETLRRLTLTGEELPLLLAAAEPPPGFETRVLGRLGASGFRGLKGAPPLGTILAVAAVTVAIVAGLGGWGLRSMGDHPSPPLSSAALVSAGRGDVGWAYYYAGSPRWMYVRVDRMEYWNGTVTCQVAEADGKFITVSSFRLTGGYGSWGTPVPEVSGPVTGARLLGPGGRVLATTRFLRPGQERLHRPGDVVQRLGGTVYAAQRDRSLQRRDQGGGQDPGLAGREPRGLDGAGECLLPPVEGPGGQVEQPGRVVTEAGSAETVVEITDMMSDGHVSLPNGLGLDHRAPDGTIERVGVAPNDLTSASRRDWLAGTPWHKYVPARIEPVE